MQPTSLNFKKNASRALSDPQLQRALSNVKTGFIAKRAEARAALPEFDPVLVAMVEEDLRLAAEDAFRVCARQAKTDEERFRLVDRANTVRPLTWI